MRRRHSARRDVDFLVETGAVLASSLDYRTLISHVARLATGHLCELCVIDVFEAAREPARVVCAHADPARDAELQAVQARHPPRWPCEPAHRAAAERRGVLLAELARAESPLAQSGFVALARRFGLHSSISVPMLAHARVVGVINLASARRYAVYDQRLAEELARRATAALHNAELFNDAQRALQIREEFLQLASHELRTPLTAMLLALQTLERTIDRGPPFAPERLAKKTGVALEQAERLVDLADAMIEATRISTGELKLKVEPFDMMGLVEDLIARFSTVAAARNGSLLIEPRPEAMPGAWDRSGVRQILRGLLSNALQHCAGKPVQVGISGDAARVRLTVRDHGEGMGVEELARIFRRFERLVSLRNFGGLGLGLYISHALARAHGGELRAESARGAGTTFVVDLPRHTTPTTSAPSVQAGAAL